MNGDFLVLGFWFFLSFSQADIKLQKEKATKYERDLLDLVGYNFLLEHPHQFLVKYARRLGGNAPVTFFLF